MSKGISSAGSTPREARSRISSIPVSRDAHPLCCLARAILGQWWIPLRASDIAVEQRGRFPCRAYMQRTPITAVRRPACAIFGQGQTPFGIRQRSRGDETQPSAACFQTAGGGPGREWRRAARRSLAGRGARPLCAAGARADPVRPGAGSGSSLLGITSHTLVNAPVRSGQRPCMGRSDGRGLGRGLLDRADEITAATAPILRRDHSHTSHAPPPEPMRAPSVRRI